MNDWLGRYDDLENLNRFLKATRTHGMRCGNAIRILTCDGEGLVGVLDGEPVMSADLHEAFKHMGATITPENN